MNDDRAQRIEAALRALLGPEPERYGYQGAANMLDDALRAAAWAALEACPECMAPATADCGHR
jgi:hypothetical protein